MDLKIWAAVSGVLVELLFFIRGEQVHRALQIAQFYVVLIMPLLYSGKLLVLSHFMGLFLSMIVYRVFFHRLRHFPGPVMAKVSKLYGLWMSRGAQYYLEVEKLHDKYGDIVRVGLYKCYALLSPVLINDVPGPNELSVRNVDGLVTIHGPQSRCSKGQLYDTSTPWSGVGQVMNRDKPLHKERKKVWDQAFSTKSKFIAFLAWYDGLTCHHLTQRHHCCSTTSDH